MILVYRLGCSELVQGLLSWLAACKMSTVYVDLLWKQTIIYYYYYYYYVCVEREMLPV